MTMAKYTPRLTAPEKSNRYYYSNDNIFYASGYGMPNCTAYACGRLMEILGKKVKDLLGNAEDWFAAAKKAGYKTGKTPKLGAIACYKAGKVKDNSDGAGHVCVVEEIKPNGDIVTSNSAWKGTEFYLKTLTKASGYQYAESRQFQGFIYPGIEFDEETSTSSSTSSATGSNEYQCIHTCVKGDTLWALAVKYLGNGSKYTQIKVLNGLTSNDLSIGQKLKIPHATTKTYQCIHKVVKGDTLWALAVKYLGKGNRYKEIMAMNGLTSDALTIGMELKIPNK